MGTLNLGILAHVDAGKTTLTERLLFNAGVIDEIGRVDDGNTQADTLALERQRGITIKSAVVSFTVDDVTVNLIDTPGHPDFIAEVERVLGVLDGAVLVVSAVEGVQAQTRILMRALRRLNVPTLVFVNKIDRVGADYERVVAQIADKLSPAAIAMGTTQSAGTGHAEFVLYPDSDDVFAGALTEVLTSYDDDLLAAYLDDRLSPDLLRRTFSRLARSGFVHPVYAGSAMTGAGVAELTAGLTRLLPRADGRAGEPTSGAVFKVERGPVGEKVAYVRMFAGKIAVRDRVVINGADEGKVTSMTVFGSAADQHQASAEAGQIARLRGLGGVRIGDTIGELDASVPDEHYFAPPTLQTAVVPSRPSDKRALRVALTQLAEQDPLIDLRQDDARQGLYVSLYGEVQKEVIQATLLAEYGLETTFQESTPICIERPVAVGVGREVLNAPSNPYLATIGLRIAPLEPGAGVTFRLDVDHSYVPIYLYKSVDGFAEMMEAYVRDALEHGPHGWQVTDCSVTMIECRYSSWDGPPKYRGPTSTSSDFRDVTPVVVAQALRDAGTRECPPMHRFRLEIPPDAYGAVSALLAQASAVQDAPELSGGGYACSGSMPADKVHAVQQQLPALTRGEGVLETAFSHYE